MTQPAVPAARIVLLGAGHAHVGVLRSHWETPIIGARITLATRRPETPYSGMLPGLIAGLYTYDDAHIDTRPLCAYARAELIIAEATGLDLANKRILCRDHPPVPFDVLSIDIGSTPSARDVPGVAEHAIRVKPIDGFLQRFEFARERILARHGDSRIGVVGAGAGGVELMLALHARLTRDVRIAGFDPRRLQFTLFGADDDILPTFPSEMRRRFRKLLTTRTINVLTNSRVTAVTGTSVQIEDRNPIAIDDVFWTTAAAPAPWLRETGLALDGNGFIRVTATLQSVSHPHVFAAGDVAMIDGHPTPRSGVYAVRAAVPLTENLRRMIAGQPLIDYRPQREALYLISTGERYAIGTRNGTTLGGRWVWWLKDWIDRRFMARFKNLPSRRDQSRP